MQIQQLKYFVAVCEQLNFTRAAKQFYVSQSAITLQIKSLEDELGVQLFVRDKHHVELTPAGHSFFDDARAILKRVDDAVERTRRTDTGFQGHLSIGFCKGYEKTELPKQLERFHEKYPNISLKMTRENVAELYDGLFNESLDFVWNLFYSDRDLKGIEYRILHKYPLYAVMPASHPLAHRTSIRRNELRGYPNVETKTLATRYGERDYIYKYFLQDGFVPNVQYTSDDAEISILAAAAGLGYSLLPGYITDAIPSGENVVVIPVEGAEKEITLVVAWNKNNKNTALPKILSEVLPDSNDGRCK